jgi:asparagine N-glycosylation enzyme membrane subunit Stt3
MMMLASLAIVSGATARIAWVNSIFGLHTWMALFGPVVALGALLLVVRCLMTRRLDREFAIGYAALALATVVAARLAVTDVWGNWAGAILKS